MERAAGAELRLEPDAPAVALGDLLADGKADARAGVLAHGMQALEQHEDALEVLRLDADAVVGDADAPLGIFLLRRDVDARRRLAAELERIADQVLEELHELHLVDIDARQRIPADRGPGLLDRRAQIGDGALERRLEGHGLELLALGADPRVGEQVLDQLLHARRAVDHVVHEFAPVAVELVAVAPREQLRVRGHHAQRLLQVVRGDVCKLLELGVGALQLLGLLRELVVRAAQLRLGALAGGDVGADAAVAAKMARVVVDRLAGYRDPARAARGIGTLHLEVAERLVALEHGAVARPVFGGYVERRLVPALAAEVGRGLEAGALAHAARHEGEAEALVLLPVPVGRKLRQAAEARLALAQRLLAALPLGDVVENRDLVERRAVG